MPEDKRERKCPKCGSSLLARENTIVMCLDGSCDWAVQSKRQEDGNIPLVIDLQKQFNGQ